MSYLHRGHLHQRRLAMNTNVKEYLAFHYLYPLDLACHLVNSACISVMKRSEERGKAGGKRRGKGRREDSTSISAILICFICCFIAWAPTFIA